MGLTFRYAEDAATQIGGLVLADFTVSSSNSKVVSFETDAGYEIELRGSGLKVRDGVVVAGEITKTTLFKEGEAFITVSGSHEDARKFDHSSFEPFFIDLNTALLNSSSKMIGSNGDDAIGASKGRDVMLGRGGNDTLVGMEGNDRMTGGAGNDTFQFVQGYGKDIVTDFDAIGGVGNQDLIGGVDFDAVVVRASGKNTIIDLGGGDTLTLLNVHKADIDATDFV